MVGYRGGYRNMDFQDRASPVTVTGVLLDMAAQTREPVRLRVRLLGDLEVTRSDGSVVDPGAWHTGKTTDLLRILALSSGHFVRTESIVARLWPDVDLIKGHGSLRTAASRIRHAIGFNCLLRQPGRLMMTSAEVDVVEFRMGVAAIRGAAARSRWSEMSDLSRHVEALYTGNFHAWDDESGWASFERSELIRLRLCALIDTAECGLRHGQFHQAQDLARVAVRIGPSSEPAHRALMEAHAGLSDVGSALRVFETFRAHLDAELGVSPSRVTRELHLRLLRDESL